MDGIHSAWWFYVGESVYCKVKNVSRSGVPQRKVIIRLYVDYC